MDAKTFIQRANEENGQCISVGGDPDNADYRRGFHIGMAQGGNYVADKEVNPTSVTFANGRRVFLNPEGFLDVEDVQTEPTAYTSSCPECGKIPITDKKDGSNHEEGCQIGVSEQVGDATND